MKAGWDLDILIATEILGVKCLHIIDYVLNEVRREVYRQEAIRDHGEEPPAWYLDERMAEYQGAHREKWCVKCHERDVSLLHRWEERNLPAYSSDMSSAMKVAAVFPFFYLWWSKELSVNGQQWECKLTADDDRRFYALAETAPIAICVAALKAKGIEVPA